MIPPSRLQEFGFNDSEKFPQHLCRHAVTLTLPTAIEHGVAPLEVVIEDGLVIPVQSSGTGGMIILADGSMLYVSHRDVSDPASPLESRFTREIPYELRSSASNIMRRAVLADPSLAAMWGRITEVWQAWFPPLEGGPAVRSAGEFGRIEAAWHGMAAILEGWTARPAPFAADPGLVRVRFVVQSDAEFRQGWMGEELAVDETSLGSVLRQGKVRYMMQNLFPRMQAVLRSPMFSSGSVFRLYYGSRGVHLVCLVVVPPPGRDNDAAGIELTLEAIDGFLPPEG